MREIFGYEEGWGVHELGELEGLLEAIDQDLDEEHRTEVSAHGVTPFPEA